MAFLTVLIPAIEYYETLKKVKGVSSEHGKQLSSNNNSVISIKPILNSYHKMHLQLRTMLVEFLKAGKKIPYTYLVFFWLAFILIQNIIKASSN